MHSFAYRSNALFTFGVTILAIMCIMVSVSDNFNNPSPQAQIEVLKINRFKRQPNGNDEVSLTMNISADLQSLFTWNTKQAVHSSSKVGASFQLLRLGAKALQEGGNPKKAVITSSLSGTISSMARRSSLILAILTKKVATISSLVILVVLSSFFKLATFPMFLMVFVFVAAEYETPKNVLNQVSLWDAIIPSKEHAKFSIPATNKYGFVDQGSNLRGQEFNLTVHWHVMPKTGYMYADKKVISGFRLPEEYR